MPATAITMSPGAIRNQTIFIYSLYIALDTYCSTIGYLDHESDLLSWFFPDLLAIVLLAAYVFCQRYYSSDVKEKMYSWTYMIGLTKPLLNIIMYLQWLMDGSSPELSFYPGQHGGWLVFCVNQDSKVEPFSIEGWGWHFWDPHTDMCDIVIIRRALHGLNFVFGLVAAAVLRRDTIVLKWVSTGFWAVYALVIVNIGWRFRNRLA
jgi:hypothetical protein